MITQYAKNKIKMLMDRKRVSKLMIKLFSTKFQGLKQPSKAANNNKENFNANLGGPKQDTFERKSNNNISFAGKGTHRDLDYIEKKFDTDGGLTLCPPMVPKGFKLKQKYINTINQDLRGEGKAQSEAEKDQKREEAIALVIKIGKKHDQAINQKITEKVVVPLLQDPYENRKLAGMKILGGISQADLSYANNNVGKLKLFFTTSQDIDRNPNLANVAINIMGDIGADQSDLAKHIFDSLMPIVKDERQNRDQHPKSVFQAVNSIYRIAEANGEVKELVKQDLSILGALKHAHDQINDQSIKNNAYILIQSLRRMCPGHEPRGRSAGTSERVQRGPSMPAPRTSSEIRESLPTLKIGERTSLEQELESPQRGPSMPAPRTSSEIRESLPKLKTGERASLQEEQGRPSGESEVKKSL